MNRSSGLTPPTDERLRELARSNHMTFDEGEIADFSSIVPSMLETFARIEEGAPETPAPPERDSRPPADGEDDYNAFVRYCDIQDPVEGPLAEYVLGVKDNIAVAGVPMSCGSEVLDGYVPIRDATAVDRVLAAGARIVGKNTMDAFALGGSGELAPEGPVRNPIAPDHLAGGSSSGSAAAIVAGEVDAALATDQGGSIRIPAAWCGCVGFKPSYGAVPYTGAVPLGHSLDHLGPMAGTVSDCEAVYRAIAGTDPADPRQAGTTPELGPDPRPAPQPSEVTVGLLEEGVERDEVDDTVATSFRNTVSVLEEAGVAVREVSVPIHERADAIWAGIANGEICSLFRDEGVPRAGRGQYDDHFARAFAQRRRARADDFQPIVKLTLAIGEYLRTEFGSRHYIEAKRQARELQRAYETTLADVDVLALPTTPQLPHAIDPSATRISRLVRGLTTVANTCPFNVTGHPAISIPGQSVSALPVGLMLVGDRNSDERVLAIARALERVLDSTT